jgi:hypothetical protein
MERSNRVFVISDSEDIFQKISHIGKKLDAIDFVYLGHTILREKY